MLLILTIILPEISKSFFPLFLIYSHAITYYSYIIPQTYCVSDIDHDIQNSNASWLIDIFSLIKIDIRNTS